MLKPKDISGQVFGKITVVKFHSKVAGGTNWVCRCACGEKRVIFKGNLTSGRQVSCGCHNREMARIGHTTHGMYGTKLHKIWTWMLTRCYNEKSTRYSEYGGRGIKTCKRWKDDFMEFYNDMASTYKSGLELDRINVNGNYLKRNCRWATKKQQSRNRRNTIYLTIDGKTCKLIEWAEENGVKIQNLRGDKNKVAKRIKKRTSAKAVVLTQKNTSQKWAA